MCSDTSEVSAWGCGCVEEEGGEVRGEWEYGYGEGEGRSARWVRVWLWGGGEVWGEWGCGYGRGKGVPDGKEEEEEGGREGRLVYDARDS